MARSDEAENFFAAVYQAVQQIPYGKVTSYGHIAELIGRPECPRQVGVCLKHLPSISTNPDAYFNNANVPWQRVINSKGAISFRSDPGAAQRHADALIGEGVQVERVQGEFRVDLSEYGWYPHVLPSDTAGESS